MKRKGTEGRGEYRKEERTGQDRTGNQRRKQETNGHERNRNPELRLHKKYVESSFARHLLHEVHAIMYHAKVTYMARVDRRVRVVCAA